MSAGVRVRSNIIVKEDAERGHRICLLLSWLLALALVLVIAGYGLVTTRNKKSVNRRSGPRFNSSFAYIIEGGHFD